MRIKISLIITCFFATIILFITIFGNIEKLNIDIAYGIEKYTFSKTWGSSGTGDGQFMFPHSLAIDRYGNIYVTDTGNNRVQKFSSSGSFITKWGEEGSADGQFSQLHDIAIHPNSKFIYTVELDNHRVQKFFPNGTFISKFGYEKTGGDAEKRNPHQLYVDSSGNIYLSDRRNSES